MRFEKLDQADVARMFEIENAIVKVLLPFRDGRTPIALVVFALARVLRRFLFAAPPATRDEQLPLIVGFLQGAEAEPKTRAERLKSASPLWLPPTTH